jgi:hypothetical protein
VPKRYSSAALIVAGVTILMVGYLAPPVISHGSRPYVPISVMSIGAMLMIAGALLWTDS